MPAVVLTVLTLTLAELTAEATVSPGEAMAPRTPSNQARLL
jgi:hypothetical protein